ncbi:MAG: ATP-grasp fold amidoligase family protein [Verrucomicrobiales bacterium]|nr:ATP-grasp fold amidoligase family protein [Verrucomicrobiales bacterium]
MTFSSRSFRYLVKRWVRVLPVPVLLKEKVLFLFKLGYWPDFVNPVSFSEKVHFRKLNDRDSRLVTLSDKFQVRKFVAERIGEEYLVPLLYCSETITPEQILECGDDIVVKRNDNSGSVYLVSKNSESLAQSISEKVKRLPDYGKLTNEWWYREIPSKILVEKRLVDPANDRPIDYKLFVFNDYLFVEVIRRHDDGTIECGFFDEALREITVDGEKVQYRGCQPFNGPFPATDTFEEMKRVARALSVVFNFVRIDLYSVSGRVYFGEITFCPSEGRHCVSPTRFDIELGAYWKEPLLLSQSKDETEKGSSATIDETAPRLS